MSKLSDVEKRQKVQVLYGIARENIPLSSSIVKRAEAIMNATSIRSFDALHIASAEVGGADYLLTTDDRLEKAYAKIASKVKVINPLKYITEVIGNE
jgi:predicted nucleic acid-binding protein